MKIIVEFKLLDGDKEAKNRLRNAIYRIKGVEASILNSYFSKDETLDFVEARVCDFTKTTPYRIKLAKRKDKIALEARQICHYLARELNLGTLAAVGKRFGDKDHATVLYSCKTIGGYLDKDKIFKKDYQQFIESFFNHDTTNSNLAKD